MHLSKDVNEPSIYDPPRFPAKGCIPLSLLVFIFMLALLLNTCVSRDVVARATSPDGSVVARLYEIDGGATTDFAYTVQVSRTWPRWDHQVADFYGAVRSECAYGVNMRWRNDRTLILEFLKARDASFERSVRVAGRTINVIPQSDVTDSKAPCGGMLYNQQGRPYDRQ